MGATSVDHWTFITKTIDGTYPNWRQVVPAKNRKVTRIKLDQEAIQLMLDVLPRLPSGDDDHQPVTLIVEDGEFRLLAKAKVDKQPSEVPIPGAELSGVDARSRVDRSFVIKALRFGFATFELTDELSPILFTGRPFVSPGEFADTRRPRGSASRAALPRDSRDCKPHN